MTVLAAEIALVGIALLAIGIVVAVFLRRRLLSHDHDVVMCGYREDGAPRWRPSLLRMTPTAMQIFPLFGWTTRPTYSWVRNSIDLVRTVTLEDDGGLAAVVDQQGRARRVTAVGVTESGRRMRFDLALSPVHYTVVRYWVEAAPPTRSWAL